MFISPKDAKYVFFRTPASRDSRATDPAVDTALKLAANQLTKITAFSGIKRKSETSDTTALGDRYRNNTAVGMGMFEDMTMNGRAKRTAAGVEDPASAYARIDVPAEGPDTLAGFLRVIYLGTVAAPTMYETVKVTVSANDLGQEVGDHVMFEAMFKSAAEVEADYERVGM